jgi:hypothetical protein
LRYECLECIGRGSYGDVYRGCAGWGVVRGVVSRGGVACVACGVWRVACGVKPCGEE